MPNFCATASPPTTLPTSAMVDALAPYPLVALEPRFASTDAESLFQCSDAFRFRHRARRPLRAARDPRRHESRRPAHPNLRLVARPRRAADDG